MSRADQSGSPKPLSASWWVPGPVCRVNGPASSQLCLVSRACGLPEPTGQLPCVLGGGTRLTTIGAPGCQGYRSHSRLAG